MHNFQILGILLLPASIQTQITVLFPTMFHDFVFCAIESWKVGLGNTIRVLFM